MEIKEKIKNLLAELSGQEVFDNDAKLQENLALDSLAMVTMLVQIEDVFEIQLDETDMNPFDLITVQNVIDLVEKYCGEGNE